jgi:type IV pilus assembly protein PilC
MAFTPPPVLTPGASAQTLALFCHEMATMLKAGMPLDAALDQAAAAGPLFFHHAIMHLADGVRTGRPLSESMRQYRTLFNPVMPAMVAAAENTGNLDESFALLAGYFEAEVVLGREIRSALFYPTMVLITAILAVIVLAWVGFFKNANMAVQLGWILAGGVGLWFALRFRAVQAGARHLAMVLPFFGGIMHQLAVARFCQTFGTLVRAGVPYLEGLEATVPVIQHPIVGRAVQYVYFGVRNGNPLEQSIRSQPAFPAIVRNLVGAGETAGSVDQALLKAGEFLRSDAEYKIRNSAKFAGPVMTIIAAIIVLMILLSFWQTYFEKIFSILDD